MHGDHKGYRTCAGQHTCNAAYGVLCKREDMGSSCCDNKLLDETRLSAASKSA